MIHSKKPSCFDPEKCLAVKLCVDKESPLGYMFYLPKKDFKICCHRKCSLSCWIVIGLSIHFEKWVWIWIWINHKFVMDLDWIDNPKKLD